MMINVSYYLDAFNEPRKLVVGKMKRERDWGYQDVTESTKQFQRNTNQQAPTPPHPNHHAGPWSPSLWIYSIARWMNWLSFIVVFSNFPRTMCSPAWNHPPRQRRHHHHGTFRSKKDLNPPWQKNFMNWPKPHLHWLALLSTKQIWVKANVKSGLVLKRRVNCAPRMHHHHPRHTWQHCPHQLTWKRIVLP